jgi:integrase
LLLGTGCRYNEIRCLKWTEIDLIQGKIIIVKSTNSDMRSVPIRGLPLELLRDLFNSPYAKCLAFRLSQSLGVDISFGTPYFLILGAKRGVNRESFRFSPNTKHFA